MGEPRDDQLLMHQMCCGMACSDQQCKNNHMRLGTFGKGDKLQRLTQDTVNKHECETRKKTDRDWEEVSKCEHENNHEHKTEWRHGKQTENQSEECPGKHV